MAHSLLIDILLGFYLHPSQARWSIKTLPFSIINGSEWNYWHLKKRKKVISVLSWKSKGCNFVIFSHLSTTGRMEVVLPLDRILTTCQSDISRCPSGLKKKIQPFSHYFSPSELRVSSSDQPEMKNSGNNLFFNNWISDCLSPPLQQKAIDRKFCSTARIINF